MKARDDQDSKPGSKGCHLPLSWKSAHLHRVLIIEVWSYAQFIRSNSSTKPSVKTDANPLIVWNSAYGTPQMTVCM